MICLKPYEFETVICILKKHVPKYEVRAFGSRYKWTNKDYSDLDIVIMSTEKMSLSQIAELEEAFEESGLTFRVDVLDYNAISDGFKAIIENGFEVIYNG